jgi:hypothetical protein
MGKYASHEEFGINAPINYRESYLKGMSLIAPPGMRPKQAKGRKFEEKSDFKASTRWHRNFDIAMFGGTEIPAPSSESKQMALEEMLDHVKRRPGKR